MNIPIGCVTLFHKFNYQKYLCDGTKPYQQVPFQFSVHVENEHYKYLHDSESDPREKFLMELKKSLGTSGSILVYYKSFEMIFGEVDKKKTYQDLLKYCGLDTEAMVWIVDELKKIINS